MRLPAILILLTVSILLLCSCDTGTKSKLKFTSPSADTTIKPKQVSMKDLRKTYNNLHGQKIETEGIVWFQFENVSICPSRDALSDEERKCFWLDFHQGLNLNDSLMQMASGRQFTLRGTVDTSETGHLGRYLGTIKNIYFMQQK